MAGATFPVVEAQLKVPYKAQGRKHLRQGPPSVVDPNDPNDPNPPFPPFAL